jgi:predicted nucleotidyltransferase
MTEDLSKQIRLTNNELLAIQQAFIHIFLPNDHIWLFGSRANLMKKGGDIDLYIETNISEFEDAKSREDKLVFILWDKIGEQKIDVVLNLLPAGRNLPIYKIAKETGVKLV